MMMRTENFTSINNREKETTEDVHVDTFAVYTSDFIYLDPNISVHTMLKRKCKHLDVIS
jgi:hypothetical protein